MGLLTYLTLFRLAYIQHVTFPDLSTHLANVVSECIQMQSLQHPEVFCGTVNSLWAGQLRIWGSTASYSLTRHIGMQPEQSCFFLATVFFSIHYKPFLPYKTTTQ